jgi:hypothetical protein
MKNIFPFFLYVMIVNLLFFSCQRNENDTVDLPTTINVDVLTARGFEFSDIFEIKEIISLKNSQNLPITSIKRIINHQNGHWILTPEMVLLIEKDGTIKNIRDSKGSGPAEYKSLDDIQWNALSSEMEILDTSNGKLLRYNEKGNYLGEWRNKYLYASYAFLPDGINYWIYGGTAFDGDGFRLVKVNSKTGIKENSYFPLGKEKDYLNILSENLFLKTKEDFRFYYSFNDTLYSISDGDIKKMYFLDFGKNSIPANLFEEEYTNIMEFFERLKSSGLAYNLNGLAITDNHIFLRFFQNGKPITGLLKKENGSLDLVKNWESKYGEKYRILSSYFISRPVGSDSESIYFALDPYEIKSAVDSLTDDPNLQFFLEENPEIKNIYDQFGSYENPYILKLKVKNL